MKKHVIILLIMLMLFGISGCNNKKETDEKLEINKEETVIDEGGTTPIETVTENAYSDNAAVKADATIDYSNATGTIVTDEKVLSELKDYIDKFYYNFLFNPSSETGEITEKDMQLFAISHIYQYEYDGLRFDSDTFTLYIPEANVSEVIKRFFDYNFTNHKYPAQTRITYEDGYYLMPARDEKIESECTISKVLKISDSVYKIFFNSLDNITYEAIVEERDSRWIILNYKKIDTAKESTESTTNKDESTTEENETDTGTD